jgi:hypothetical protein
MWKETAATEPPKWKDAATEPPKTSAPATAAQPVTEHELREMLDRLGAARDIFRLNRELREVLSRRETETKALRSRNAELEEIVRKFAPVLMDAANAMGSAAKDEKPVPEQYRSLEEQEDQVTKE